MKAISALLLSVLFFAIVTPLGIIARAFGADPLARNAATRSKASAFRVRDHRYGPDDLAQPS